MPYFALIIMFYHVKIACYQVDVKRKQREIDECVRFCDEARKKN